MASKEDLCGSRIIHLDRINKAQKSSLDQHIVEDLAQLFKALADSSRLKIIRALEKGEMCVCDLAALLGVSESAVSHQLRLLRNLRLVRNRREGTVLYYRLADDHVSQLVSIALEHVKE